MPTKDEREQRHERGQRPDDEDATIGEQQEKIQQDRDEAKRRKDEGTVRHGPQPPERGLEGDEPFGQDITGDDDREGVIKRGSFRHVEKDRARRPERSKEED